MSVKIKNKEINGAKEGISFIESENCKKSNLVTARVILKEVIRKSYWNFVYNCPCSRDIWFNCEGLGFLLAWGMGPATSEYALGISSWKYLAK